MTKHLCIDTFSCLEMIRSAYAIIANDCIQNMNHINVRFKSDRFIEFKWLPQAEKMY